MNSRFLRRSLIVLGIVLAAALAAPFLIPVARFIPEVSKMVSAALGQPVEIADLRLQLLPTPRAVASGIRIGKAGEAKIGELQIVPDLLALLTGSRRVRVIYAQRVELQEAALAIPAAMPKKEGGDKSGEALRVRRVVLTRVKLHHRHLKLPEFDVVAELGAGLRVVQARLETRDRALKLSMRRPAEGATELALTAKHWTLPAGPPFVFESLKAQGSLKSGQLDVPSLEGRFYGGSLAGGTRLGWGREWQLSGNARLDGVDLAPLQQVLGKPPKLTGRLRGTARFSARARSGKALGDVLALEGPFEVLKGAYQGVDLAAVKSLPTGEIERGGATQFEELKGLLQLRGRRVRIEQLCIRSPALAASGKIEVAPDRRLSGSLNVSVANTGGIVGVPVRLSGNTSDPSVSLTTGAKIGAVVGTVLLPGIGTALGVSAGQIGGGGGCK